MLYHLAMMYVQKFSVLNVVRYITFRTVVASLTSLAISFAFGPALIRWLTALKVDQTIRDDGPPTHLSKKGTPTMGGTLILISIIIPTLLWADLYNRYVWGVLLVSVGMGIIGFVDDYLKVAHKNPKGIGGKNKIIAQLIVASLAAALIFTHPKFEEFLVVPFFKNIKIPLGLFYIPFGIFLIIGSSNAVNLTDGLDGLAIGPVMTTAGMFIVLSYVVGNYKFATYLQLPYVYDAGNLAVFCGAMTGAGLGFLWYNTYPAQVFMGDVGSLALGGALGAVSLITKTELLLAIAGGIFVLETISVIVQVVSFKLTGKRVFAMAPIHHHYELKGWAEPKVIVRFWIISIILALIALTTLKLR